MASKNVPNTLRLFQVRVEGQGYAGKVDAELPAFDFDTEEFSTGMGKVEALGELGVLECMLNFSEIPWNIYQHLTAGGGNKTVTVMGSIAEAGTGRAIKIEVVMTGEFKGVGSQTLERGKPVIDVEVKVTINSYYRMDYDGLTLNEVDYDNYVLVSGGVDLIGQHRANAGL